MAEGKLDDAILLLKSGRFSNAYYLAGYAVELGLKACIAGQIAANTIPDKAFIKNILSHQPGVLVGLAGLAGELKKHQDANPDFSSHWAIVAEWEPDSRYHTTEAAAAQLLIKAIADPKSGVLQWIRQHW